MLASKMVNHPLTQYMFCSPGEGAVALVLARGERARTLARAPVYLRSVAFRTRRFGSFEVFSPSIPIAAAPSPTTEAAAAAFEQAGVGPEDVDVAQLQDTESGAEVMHLAETGPLRARRAGVADPERRDAPRRPAAGQHRRRLPGQRRADRRVRPAAGPRGRAAAARRGGRAPGRRAGARRVHAGLRRAGGQRVHRAQPLSGREVQLAAYPDGELRTSDFRIVEVPVREPGPGEVLVRNTWTSVDPGLRLRLRRARAGRLLRRVRPAVARWTGS